MANVNFSTWIRRIVLIFGLIAVVAVAGWYARPSQAGVNLKIRLAAPANATQGLNFDATLDALNVPTPGLGVWTIDVLYNPDDLAFVSCLPKLSTSCNNFVDGSDANIRFSGFTLTPGLTGNVELGNIVFSATMPGLTSLGLEIFGLSDTDSTNLTPGLDTNTPDVTISLGGATSSPTPSVTPTPTEGGPPPSPSATTTPGDPTFTATPTEEDLPGVDDTPTDTATPTDTRTPTDTPTSTPTSVLPPPPPSVTPQGAQIRVSKAWAHRTYPDLLIETDEFTPPRFLFSWLIRLYSGGGCLGAPIDTGLTSGIANFPLTFLVDPGEYSVAEEVVPGWERDEGTPFCATLTVGPGQTEFFEFRNSPIHNGDVNKDGVANAVDATLLLQLVAGLIPPASFVGSFGEANSIRLDVDGDLRHTSRDVALILQHEAGFLDSLPPR